jgi:hypothetical protein
MPGASRRFALFALCGLHQRGMECERPIDGGEVRSGQLRSCWPRRRRWRCSHVSRPRNTPARRGAWSAAIRGAIAASTPWSNAWHHEQAARPSASRIRTTRAAAPIGLCDLGNAARTNLVFAAGKPSSMFRKALGIARFNRLRHHVPTCRHRFATSHARRS